MNPLLLPFSALFRIGVGLRHAGYRFGWAQTHRLSRPVISMGNLTVGGTGKTPLVAAVANILLSHGLKPSILTRGYGRKNTEKLVMVRPGVAANLNPKEIGDEPALLARLLPEVPIVLCGDRYLGGKTAEEQFHVDAHILDDGFQHLALARNLDIVALDATQKLSNWNLLPAGRQREPLSALKRAQIAIITRTDSGNAQALSDRVARINPATQVFHSQTVVRAWLNLATGETIPQTEIQAAKVAAFCGIGNPSAFFGDLRRSGFDLATEDAFPDHHVYTGGEIERLAERAQSQGASALVTTQKDSVKISSDWPAQMPIYYCEIEARILEAQEFEKSMLAFLNKAS